MHKKKDPKFGERLKWLRKKNAYPVTQQEVAARIGVSRVTYQRYEYGFTPNRSNLNKIIDFFDCRRLWLLTGRGEPFNREAMHDKDIAGSGRTGDSAALYRPLGGRQQADGDDFRLLGQIYEILKSDTIYREALINSIKAYHAGVVSGSELQRTRDKLSNLAEEDERLKLRLEILEAKVAELDRDCRGDQAEH